MVALEQGDERRQPVQRARLRPLQRDGHRATKDKWDGCVTKSYTGVSVSFTPNWYQVLPGVDLSAPMTYAIGVDGNAAVVLKLLPKDDRSFVLSFRMLVLESSAEVRRIPIIDQNETETTYAIRSIRLNTNVPDSVFTFSAPAGIEVVDLR